MDQLHVLIMAGGAGTRFWPLSRRLRPKQFLPLAAEEALLGETARRIEGLCPPDNIWILTRRELGDAVREVLPWISRERLVEEPEGRDTAPCLVLGAARVARVAPEALILVLPADHVIPDAEGFRETVRGAIATLLEEGDALLTFGIPPTFPATGYGYIRCAPGEPCLTGGVRSRVVESFEEKPGRTTAEAYLKEGLSFWNGGIFLWRLPTFRAALETHAPDLAAGWKALEGLGGALERPADQQVAQIFHDLRRVSIDYALLEHAEEVRMVEAEFEWDDLGSWSAVERHRPVDGAGNLTEGRVLPMETRGCTILGRGGRVITTLGLQGLLIIDTPDALLVCPKGRSEEVKRIVSEAERAGWEDVL